MEMVSPVVLFVYNREGHAAKTLEALSRNQLAEQSRVFVFSDGPKTEKDKEKVKRVRETLEQYQGDFLEFEVIKADNNRGLANSVILGVTEIIKKYGKVIVLEDDIVTTPYFLSYMNQALDYYETNERIWSITGYTLPMRSLNKYEKDVFFSFRACSWGWGTWVDRWDNVDWELKDYFEYKTDRQRIWKFERGGKDLPLLLENQKEGKIDSWAIRWCYYQSKYDMLTVYPRVSLVQNIGYDGTGTHGGNEKVFCNQKIENIERAYQFANVKVDKRIVKEFREIYSATLWFRIKRKLREILRK